MAQRTEIVLEDEQREVLERWARRPKSSQALAFRCRVVLAAAEGRSSNEIAVELGCNANTVSKWRSRFARRGIDGLHTSALSLRGMNRPTGDLVRMGCSPSEAAGSL